MGSPLLLIGQKEAPLQTWGDVTAAGPCSELGLQMEQKLGMRTHCPTPYKPIPEILPTEVFCPCHCAGKQGGGQCSARHQGGSTDGGSALGCGGEAPPPSPPRAAPEQSSTQFPTQFHPRPLQFSVWHQEELFLFIWRARQPRWEPRAAEKSAWSVTHGKSRAAEPQRNRKDEQQESPQFFPWGTQLRVGQKLLDGAQSTAVRRLGSAHLDMHHWEDSWNKGTYTWTAPCSYCRLLNKRSLNILHFKYLTVSKFVYLMDCLSSTFLTSVTASKHEVSASDCN